MKRRYVASLLAFALILALLPGIGAEEAGLGSSDSGRIEGITKNHVLSDDKRTIVVTPEVLQWSPSNPDIGRTVPTWWVGMNIVSPKMTQQEAKDTRFTRDNNSKEVEFSGKWDSPAQGKELEENIYEMQAWKMLNPLYISYYYLTGQKGLEYTWNFRWKGAEESIPYTLRIVPSKVQLVKVDDNGKKEDCFPSDCAMKVDNGEIKTSTTERGKVNDPIKWELQWEQEWAAFTKKEVTVKAIAPAYVDKDWITFKNAPSGCSVNEAGIVYQVWDPELGKWPDIDDKGAGVELAKLKEFQDSDAKYNGRYYIEFQVTLDIEDIIGKKNLMWRVDWDKDYQIVKDTKVEEAKVSEGVQSILREKGFEQTYILDLSKTELNCKVSFDLNGGNNVVISEQRVPYGGKVTEPPQKPTRTDYTFKGWSANRESDTLLDFSTYTVKGDTTLYAMWTKEDSNTKPGDSDTKPGDSDTKPGDSDTKPGDSDPKPGDSDTKPGDSDPKPGDSDPKPGDSDPKPGDSDPKPGDSGTKPGDSDTKPGDPDTKPADPGSSTDTTSTALPAAVRYVPWSVDLNKFGSFAEGKDYKLEEKPSWLGNRNGLLSGIPTSANTYTFTVSYTNKSGAAVKEKVSVEVLRASAGNLSDLSEENWDYRITDPAGDVYGYNGGCYLTSKGDFDEFRALYLDGSELDEGTDYGVWRGSTVVEIYPRALRSAGYGSHTIAMAFLDDGGEMHCVAQNFTIKRNDSDDDDDDNRPRVTVNNSRGGKVRAYSDGEVVITVNSGYYIAEATVNGKPVTVPASGRLTGLRARDRVEVTFAENDSRSITVSGLNNIWVPPGGTTSSGTWMSFRDVTPEAYFYDAVQWAVNRNIAKGKGNQTFQPNGTCTRADMLTFLWRVCGSPEPAGNGKRFIDVPSGSYYAKAVQWASDKGLVKGEGKRQFNPNAQVTRGEAVTFLYRAAGSPSAPQTVKFEDVRTGAYYLKPVAWALSSGVANGVSSAYFRPDYPCTRGDIMTFLYRRYG